MSPSPNPRKVHASGFVVLDLLVADGDLTPHVGGTAANVAINLSLLGWNAAVSGLVGEDPAGREIRSQLKAYGVDTSRLVSAPDVETPVVIHEVTRNRHKFRFSCPNCGSKYSRFRPLPPTEAGSAPEADVHFFDRASSYAIEVSRLRRSDDVIVFEPGTPGRPAATASMVGLAHLFRSSGDLDLPNRALVSPNVDTNDNAAQIIGLGADGVKYRASVSHDWQRRPSRVSQPPVDAAGAGDWLTACLLDGLDMTTLRALDVTDEDLDRAVDRGLDFAAACCRHLGTRGLVETEEWRKLHPGDSCQAAPGRAGPGPAKIASGGCDLWFHHPKSPQRETR